MLYSAEQGTSGLEKTLDTTATAHVAPTVVASILYRSATLLRNRTETYHMYDRIPSVFGKSLVVVISRRWGDSASMKYADIDVLRIENYQRYWMLLLPCGGTPLTLTRRCELTRERLVLDHIFACRFHS
jgi:hypothetical protein